MADCQSKIERIRTVTAKSGNIGPYAIFAGKTLVGLIGAPWISAHEYSLYYHFGKEYWGRGYATEAAKAIIAFVFQIPETIRISADTLTTNHASARVLEKVGMTYEGCLRMKFLRNGIFGALNQYSILLREYEHIREQ